MIYFIPYITPAVASAAVFRIIFSNRPDSLANQVSKGMGMGTQQWLLEPKGIFQMLAEPLDVALPAWAAGPSLALVVIIIYSVWTYVGYDTVIFLAGLGAIPNELYEAAKIDGGSRWAIFRHITLPLLSPTTFFLSLIAVIGTFKAFNHIWVLRHASALGTTDTASIVIFNEFFRNSRFGYASAMAFVLFAIILSLTLVQNRIASKRVFSMVSQTQEREAGPWGSAAEVVTTSGRPPKPINFPRMFAYAILILGAVVARCCRWRGW
ncbi:MAG: sugar ABC transporter permease [Anaerolineae bacterium]|nr:sugar ABC transporter permease [Anaerolineae bacterium]